MSWLVTAALFAASIIILLMRRIGRDAGGRADTLYFQRVGWTFAAGLLLLACGMLAGFPSRHPFILVSGMSCAYMSVYLLVLFAHSFPHNTPAPVSLRLSLGALTATLIAVGTWVGVSGSAAPLLMSASMIPYFGLTLYFLRRNWKAATAPGAQGPSTPVTIVQAAVLVPWLVSFFAYAVLAANMPRPLPVWLSLLQTLCMSLVVVGGVAVAILRYHLFEIRVLLGEAVLAVLATGSFALYVGVAAEPLHGYLAAQLSPGFAALVVAGVPPFIVHAAMSVLDRWMADMPGGISGAAQARAQLEQTLAVTGRMVDPDAVLAVVISALDESTHGAVRFLRGRVDVIAGEHERAPASLLDVPAELSHTFWSSEHRPELPAALVAWMDAAGAALVVPVRRSDALYGFLVVSQVARVPRATAMLCPRLGEHLALKFENFGLYADAALAARELADYRVFLENVVDSLPVGVAVVASDMRVRAWNRSLEKQTGIARDRAVGLRYFEDVFPNLRDDPATQEMIARLQRDPTAVVTMPALEIEEPGGTRYRDVLVTSFRDRLGASGGVVVITEDVTDRVRLGRELEESRRLASLGAFAAAIAHDIRTPLTSIQMNVQILRTRAELREADREYLDIAQEEIARLTRSVGEILDYARPLTLAAAPEDLGEIADDIARSVAAVYAEREVAVRVQRDDEGPWTAAVDDARLRKALLNLLDNAVDASARGDTVALRLSADAQCVRVTVEDRGRGIAPENLPRVFDPFFTTRPDGTGLGLAIAQKVVRAHGGELSVESAVGEGTRFTVTLPREQRGRSLPPPPPTMVDPFRASGVRPGIGAALAALSTKP